jgi:hypothetical protein
MSKIDSSSGRDGRAQPDGERMRRHRSSGRRGSFRKIGGVVMVGIIIIKIRCAMSLLFKMMMVRIIMRLITLSLSLMMMMMVVVVVLIVIVVVVVVVGIELDVLADRSHAHSAVCRRQTISIQLVYQVTIQGQL